jgi:hypothetical protein
MRPSLFLTRKEESRTGPGDRPSVRWASERERAMCAGSVWHKNGHQSVLTRSENTAGGGKGDVSWDAGKGCPVERTRITRSGNNLDVAVKDLGEVYTLCLANDARRCRLQVEENRSMWRRWKGRRRGARCGDRCISIFSPLRTRLPGCRSPGESSTGNQEQTHQENRAEREGHPSMNTCEERDSLL